MTLRDTVRDFAPPALVRALRAAFGRGVRYEGEYATWAEAQRRSEGYAGHDIAQRVLEAELKVKQGSAADARDGVAFGEMQFELPVLAALARAAATGSGTLRVLDIGGAFGRLYRQCKAFLPGIRLSWLVLEQPAYVTLGRQHFQNAELGFADDLGELTREPADALLFCSVLQYFPDPYALIERGIAAHARHVVVDRTPCSALEQDVACVQRVPPDIYPASYPCWIFSRRRLRAALTPGYAMLAAFSDASGVWRSGGTAFELCGFVLERDAAPRR